MEFNPEIKTSSLCFSEGKRFVSWKTGLKFSTNSKIVQIEKNFLIREFVGVFSAKNKTVLVADGILGILIFLIEKDSIIQTLRIKTKNRINPRSISFDEKASKLFIGFDNKIIKIGFPKIDKKITAVIEKNLKITLKKNEFIDFILKESYGEFKGFWTKTNKNSLYFIETKEITGNSQNNKLWRIRTYTKRSNFDIEQDEICFDIKSKNGFLFVSTNKKIYRFCIISTRLSLVASITFSSDISNSQMFFVKNHVFLSGNNYLGSVIVRFNENDFLDNTTFWSFSKDENLVLDKTFYSNNMLILSQYNIPGIVEIQRVIFDNHFVPYLAIDYNISHRILEDDQFIASNFTENENHLFFVAKNDKELFVKAILKKDLGLVMNLPLPKGKYNDISLSFINKDLYLLSKEGLVIIYEKEF